MSQVNLAKALKSSQSRVAKMEAGDPTIFIDLLIKSILALGAGVVGLVDTTPITLPPLDQVNSFGAPSKNSHAI
jgi:hypothetical protein